MSVNNEIVRLDSFIQSTRDSGYKSTSAALAELVDNSIEANARNIHIIIENNSLPNDEGTNIRVIDDGGGMNKKELKVALQFGGSNRFGSRTGMGRYGMGLPNASVSQARRIDVVTWKKKDQYLWNYLDVDEVSSGKQNKIDHVIKKKNLLVDSPINEKHGTHVWWRKCDRLSYKSINVLVKQLHKDLGRIYRYKLLKGVKIRINDNLLQPYDPLFQMVGSSLSGAFDYGTERIFEINKNIEIGIDPPQLVKVRFVLFPVEDWYKIPNKEKRELNITKRSGLSILRNQREIDFGWYFFGNKRRENYDDWWRAELNFEPELDEAFGVTHTKQGINPTKYIKDILSPDLERIALDLSRLVRDTFVKIKINNTKLGSINKISIRDKMYPSPKNNSNKMKIVKSNFIKPIIEYNIRYESLFTSEVFQYNYLKNKFDLTMNKDHPFYEFLIFPLMGKYFRNNLSYSNILEILIFSMARAETHSNDEDFKNKLNDFRNLWGDIFAAYIL